MLGPVSKWSELSTAYGRHLKGAGLVDPAVQRHITLHSYHGSRAARERAAGIRAVETCKNMLWTLEMYEYYTAGREPLTPDGICAMHEPLAQG